jgi:tetratricopeptide (TPR) repeat protein
LEKTDDEWREYLNSSIDNAGELAASDAEAGYTEGLSIFDDTLHNLKDTDANNRIAETEFAKARYMADNNHSRQALEELLIPMSEDDSIDVSIRYRVNLYAGVIYQRLGDTQKAEEYGSKADVLGDFGIGDDSLEENE